MKVPRRRIAGGVWWQAVVVCLLVLLAAPVMAEENADESDASQDEAFGEELDDEITYSPRAESVILFDGQVTIPRPTGWNIASPGDGAVALFRAASDEQAQIEVRVSSNIGEPDWQTFWRAFDTDLRQIGFTVHRQKSDKSYAGMPGVEIEYALVREERDTYHLLVWHTHSDDRAWVFTAFFAESRRDAYLETFREMLNSVAWSG